MKTSNILLLLLMTVFATACGGGGQSQIDQIKEQSKMEPVDPMANWKNNHGIGPVTSFELPATIDQALAAEGQEIFNNMCTACHKIDKKFIGPAPTGITDRRTPAWIMNMILNPEEMTQKDPIAKQLLIEANGSPMANQSLTKEQARAVLEYFRTLK